MRMKRSIPVLAVVLFLASAVVYVLLLRKDRAADP